MFLILKCDDCGYSKSIEIDKHLDPQSKAENFARQNLKSLLDRHIRKTSHPNVEIVKKGLSGIPAAVKEERGDENDDRLKAKYGTEKSERRKEKKATSE